MAKPNHLPILSKEWKQKSNFEILYLGMPLCLSYVLGCFLSVQAFEWLLSAPALWMKLIAAFVLFFATAYTGLHFTDFGSLAHDGGHGTLHSNLSVSFFLGVLMSSLIPGFMGVAYNETHFPHHRYCNTKRDRQAVWYATSKIARLPRFLSMFIFGAMTYYYYFLDTIAYMTGEKKVPNLSSNQSKFFSFLNVTLNIAATAGWVALFKYNLTWFVFCFFVPWLWTFVYFTHFVLTDHGDTELGFRNSRTLSHWALRFILGNNNYHLEHHIFPFVPRSRLHKLHNYLKSTDFYKVNNCIVDDRFFSFVTLAFTSKQPLYENSISIEKADQSKIKNAA